MRQSKLPLVFMIDLRYNIIKYLCFYLNYNFPFMGKGVYFVFIQFIQETRS